MGAMGQLSTEGHALISDIQERGYSEFQHGIPSEQIDYLIETYADFTLNHPDPRPETMDAMLPDDHAGIEKRLDELERSKDTQTEWHKYRTNVLGVGKPEGYTSRSFQERALKQARGFVIPAEDPKEFFHYTPRHWSAMARNHKDYGWGSIPPELSKLNQAFAPIHKKASQLVLKVAGLIEETHPEVSKYFDQTSLATSPVRLLFYHPGTSEQLGAGHYDKSKLTIQVAESHEGLQVAPNSNSPLQPVVRADDRAVVFPGLGLRDIVGDNSPYQPGWHDIVRVNRLNEGRSVPPKAVEVCARWALIFFANGANYINPDKSLTHAR